MPTLGRIVFTVGTVFRWQFPFATHCDSRPRPALPLLGIQTEDVPGIAFAFFLGKDSCLSRSTPRSRADLAVSRCSRLHTL